MYIEQMKDKIIAVNMNWEFQVTDRNKEYQRGRIWGQNPSKFLKTYWDKRTTSRTEEKGTFYYENSNFQNIDPIML